MKIIENRDNLQKLQTFCIYILKMLKCLLTISSDIFAELWRLERCKKCKSDRSRQELSNEYLVAKIGFDTAENEPLKVRITDHTFNRIPSLF